MINSAKQFLQVPGDGLMRGSLSNVCFANELQRNGLGYVIVTKSKTVASFCGNYISCKFLI